MYGISAGKMAFIVTDHAHDVADRIYETLGRGSTFLKAEGSYSEEEKGCRHVRLQYETDVRHQKCGRKSILKRLLSSWSPMK